MWFTRWIVAPGDMRQSGGTAQKAWPKIVFNELREHSGAPFKKAM
ncbi:hypothetical protein [Paraburkholderia sp.]|jgi:hypothetical protein|nr:hypothetical protein [Paraburkholderia sp.]